MARDLDFSVRRRQIPAKPVASFPGPARAAVETNKPTELNHSTAHLVWLWILIIILVGLGTWALWQYFKPASSAKSITPTVSATQKTTAVTNADKSLLAQKSTTPTIQMYDSGAGADKVKGVQDKLKSLGYSVDNLDKSQFNYDKTYIWYRTGLEAEASKVGSTMPDRQVVLKETNIAGTFDILILLGTN